MHKVKVVTQPGQYFVSIGNGLLHALSRHLRPFLRGKRQGVYVLTTPEIWALWGQRFLAALPGPPPTALFLPSGERHKRLASVEELASRMAQSGADRSALLIAFGGGVVGDVGGFLAAIYMRGIDFIQIPTTLLAQVDSSVGGKTGVNLISGKNLLGAFYNPRAVIADIGLLATLPRRELHAGLYESIKAGLIRDASLFRFLESGRGLIDRGDARTLERIVSASVRVKADVVAQDEKEAGLRMILNFGHTIGHAIEAVGGYGAMLHGEAVALGMLVALEISRSRHLLRSVQANRAAALIRSFAPPPFPGISNARLLEAAGKDKKNRAGIRRFILLDGIGKAMVAEDVSDAELLRALDQVRAGESAGGGR